VLTLGGGTVKEAVNRHFTVNAGLGFGTGVVRAIEGLRADGRRQAPGFMCGPRSAISPATPIGASPHSPWS
jgi:hypothetical protein